MSDIPRICAAASLIVGVLLAGCEGANEGPKLCQRCERPPKTVRVEVDWQRMADALKSAGVGSTTVRTGPVNVTVNPGQPTGGSNAVAVDGWNDLVEALKSIQIPPQNAGSPETTHNIHHTTFAFRFAPPWFNADQRSLFTSYVVFPVEAKFEEWISVDANKTCAHDDPRASICPDTPFYKNAMEPFLKGLSQCATTERVQLRILGFASSTELNEPWLSDESKDELKERYDNHIEAKADLCLGEIAEDETKPSNMFNLLIANERAVNAAEMLKDLVPKEPKDAFDIEAIPWCSHAAMEEERKFEDDRDPAKGLMNRRVEVRLVALPGCLNVEPDRRIPMVENAAEAAKK